MKVNTIKKPIEKKLGQYLTPKYGQCVYFAGGKGKGKTHEIINYIWHLTQDLKWQVITNIQFEKTEDLPDCPECGKELNVYSSKRRCVSCGYRDEKGQTPEKVSFVTTMTDFWKEFARIRKKEPYVPVVLVIDEFHETVNKLESHKYWNIVTGLISWQSQMRKFTQSALFCSQWLTQLPKDPRNYADYFIVKNPVVAKQVRLDGKFRGPRYTSFILKVVGQEVKIINKHDKIDWKEAKKFRLRHLNKDLEDLIRNDILSDVFVSLSCPWNDEERGRWQYKHKGVSVLEYDEINRDKGYWFKKLIRDLGEAGNDEVGDVILDFFEDYERKYEEEEEEYNLDLTDNGVRAWFDWKLSNKTQQKAASEHDTTGRTIRRTEEKIKDLLSEADRARNRTDGQGGGGYV